MAGCLTGMAPSLGRSLHCRARPNVVSKDETYLLLNLRIGANMSELSDIADALKPVSTATIATVLLNRGLRRTWMRGPRPIRLGQPRTVGLVHSPCALFRARRSCHSCFVVLPSFDESGD